MTINKKIGISTACFYPELTEKAIEWLVLNNVPYVEIFFNTFSELNDEYVKNLSKLLSASGIKTVSVHPFSSFAESFMIFTRYERRMRDTLDMYKRYFEVMNILSSDIFVFHGLRSDKAEIMGYGDEKYFEIFSLLKDAGKKFGITVAQENIAYCKSGNPDFIKKMKNYFYNDINFVFDIKQAVRYKCDPLYMLNTMGDRIIHVHISDHDELNTCLAPGEGKLDFKSLFKNLEKFSYKGVHMIELYRQNFNEPNDLLKSIKFLSDI